METITNTTEVIKSNNLIHSIFCHDKKGNSMYIKIGLNDECKNGHQDFAITCDIYEKGKPKIDKYCLGGGRMHDEIIKARPDLKIFVDLHLCNYEGIPMYAVENGFYHLTEGFNNTKPNDKAFKAEFCDYYRINTNQWDVLSKSKNKLQYALNLQNLGILAQWKEEANKAIKLLEDMTGKEFLIDSIKTQYHAPTPEELQEEEEKQLTGFYTPEAEAQRQEEAKQKELSDLNEEEEKHLTKIKDEYHVKRQVLLTGGKKALKNCIYYSHIKQLAFNWLSYGMLSEEEVNAIIAAIKLPEDVTIENKHGK